MCLLAFIICGQMQSQIVIVYIPSWAGVWRVVGHWGRGDSEGWLVGSHYLAPEGLSLQALLCPNVEVFCSDYIRKAVPLQGVTVWTRAFEGKQNWVDKIWASDTSCAFAPTSVFWNSSLAKSRMFPVLFFKSYKCNDLKTIKRWNDRIVLLLHWWQWDV